MDESTLYSIGSSHTLQYQLWGMTGSTCPCVSPGICFSSKNFAGSTCLAEVGAVLSVILAARIVYSAFGINK